MDENQLTSVRSLRPTWVKAMNRKKARNITAKFFAIPARNQREISAKNRAYKYIKV